MSEQQTPMTIEDFENLLDDLEQAASLADGCDRSAREWRKEQHKEHVKALEAYRAMVNLILTCAQMGETATIEDAMLSLATMHAHGHDALMREPVLMAEVETLRARVAELEGVGTFVTNWTPSEGWKAVICGDGSLYIAHYGKYFWDGASNAEFFGKSVFAVCDLRVEGWVP